PLETALGADVCELVMTLWRSAKATKPPMMLLPPAPTELTTPLAQLWSMVAALLIESSGLAFPAASPPARLNAPTVTLPVACELKMDPNWCVVDSAWN